MRDIEMLKFEMNELKVMNVEEVSKMIGWDFSDWFEGDIESGVYKIDVGSRGEVEDVSKVEVVDGVFEVESEEEFKKRKLNGYELYKDGVVINSKEIEEYKEELDEWVCVELNNGIVMMCESEESGYDIVRVEVEVDEEDVFENGELIIEDVSKDEVGEDGVLVYSYKGKYIVMSFDFGGSLCEIEEFDNLDEIDLKYFTNYLDEITLK